MSWGFRAIGLAALALLAVVPIASASVIRSGGYAYVEKTQTLRAGERKALAAPCPGATRVLSGGGYNTGVLDSAVMSHSFPLDTGDRGRKPDEGWRVLWTTKSRVEITTHAICADMKVEYDQVRRTLDAGATLDGGHFCEDKDRYAVGGGSSGPVRATLTKSYRHGGVHRVCGRRQSSRTQAPSSNYRVFAVCIKPQPTVASASESLPAGTQQGNSVACPAGTRVVGGGTYSSTARSRLGSPGSDRRVQADRGGIGGRRRLAVLLRQLHGRYGLQLHGPGPVPAATRLVRRPRGTRRSRASRLRRGPAQAAAACGSGLTITVSAIGTTSSTGRSAFLACSRTASGPDAS